MRTLKIILFFGLSFLASCQSKTAVENTGYKSETPATQNTGNSSPANPVETEPDHSPRPSLIKMNEIGSRIGSVQAFKEGSCLKIQNPDLKAGDKIQIIIVELPQKAALAEIVEKTSCKEPEFGGELAEPDIVEYTLKEIGGNSLNDAGYGIGLVNSLRPLKIKNGRVAVDIDNDQKDEYFRLCYSMEGMHLTVWKGKPLVGKRIWHSYYHFGFDTESDCKEKDYEGAEDE